MTEPTTPTDPAERDPLSTDDGLAEVAEAGMPEVEHRDVPPGEDAVPLAERRLIAAPGLEVDDDGTDPCAEYGGCPADEGD